MKEQQPLIFNVLKYVYLTNDFFRTVNGNKHSTASSPSLSQNYPPQNREVGMMWLDIPGHMLQLGQTSSSLQRPLNNTTNTIFLFGKVLKNQNFSKS